jgi:hypothetical protein
VSARDLLAIVILGVTADQAHDELVAGEITGTTAGEAWAIVEALFDVAEAAASDPLIQRQVMKDALARLDAIRGA